MKSRGLFFFYVFFPLFFLTACQSGPAARRQIVAPSGNRVTGNMPTVSGQGETIVGDHATINSNHYYGGMTKEQLTEELKSRDEKIKNLESELADIRPTKFKLASLKENIPFEGKFKTEFVLVPTGKLPVSILTISVSSKDSAVDEIFISKGGINNGERSQDGRSHTKHFENIPATPLQVTVFTQSSTRLTIMINPFQD